MLAKTITTTFRARIFAVFTGILLFSVLVTVGVLRVNDIKYEFYAQRIRLQTLHSEILKTVRLGRDFLLYENSNTRFFKSNTSPYLEQYLKSRRDNLIDMKEMHDSAGLDYDLKNQMSLMVQEIETYNSLFDSVVWVLKERGFRDYGQEGLMRHAIHNVEKYGNRINEILLLTIRRHEKDFLLRNDTSYITQVTVSCEKLSAEIKKSGRLTRAEKDGILKELERYQKAFLELARLDAKMGFKTGTGLSAKLQTCFIDIEKRVFIITEASLLAEQAVVRKTIGIFVAIFMSQIIFGLLLGFIIATAITKPLMKLSWHINGITANRFKDLLPFEISTNISEVADLSNNFNLMIEEIQKNFKEIFSKNEQLELLYSEITDNIRTAYLIQQSILPSSDIIKTLFPDSFVFYQPKDMVSGDIYWFGLNGGYPMVAAIDCTGHGVAGASMAFIAYTVINGLVQTEEYVEPGVILDRLNNYIINILKQDTLDSVAKVGMDVSICCYRPDRNDVTFAGAQQNMYHIRQGALTMFIANKQSIGVPRKSGIKQYITQTLPVESGDVLYLFSDGYPDMIGGPEGNQKFKTPRFKELLLNIWATDLLKQEIIIEQTAKNWLDTQEQLDDFMVIGIRLP